MDARERIIEQRIAKRKRDRLILKTIIASLLLFVLISGIVLLTVAVRSGAFGRAMQQIDTVLTGRSAEDGDGAEAAAQTEKQTEAVTNGQALEEAKMLAAQYNYDEAIARLRADAAFNTSTEYQNAAASYQAQKDSCVAYPIDQVTHVFFHTLVKDDAKAFDGDQNEAGYNQVMTTISEFNSIIEQMYAKGYVMVSLHDMCTVNEDGSVSRGEILLPPDKKPFVLSQDDVSYYHYMVGDGFADKLIVDEHGEVKNTYIEDDGSVSVGDYDMVPLIDTFVKQHPDFAYHGHKGIVALTGYEGVLGYRTDEVYKTRQEDRLTEYQRAFLNANPDFNFEQEVEEATKVAEAMKAEGWEFASHTWGHINPLGYGYDATVQDTERWLANVAPIVGGTDVLIFAFGADISDWQPYTHDNAYFDYLKGKGFNIYCNVDGSQPYWVQFGDDYMRQGRRNLDGYRMYYNPELISDLFNVDEAWDSSRPTPVPKMG